MKIIKALPLMLLVFPNVANASDFSILMWLLLIPFAIASAIVWAITWPTTAEVESKHIKAVVRSAGLCLIFTPTFTQGGNGQMHSVAMYDIVMSMLGGDIIYAKQAFINAVFATPIIYILYLLSTAKSKSNGGDS